MARSAFVRRHRAGIASGLALSVATGAVVAYAISASGYKRHEADLNDGGVWVVNGKLGWSGRLNKPINQLDGVVPSPEGKTRLDVLQDGAAVVTLNLNAGRGQSIDSSRLESQDGGAAAVPTTGDVRMAGGTLATVDADSGELWAVRYDAELGKPVMTAVDRQAEPLAEVGEGAALAVAQDGTVVATSTDAGTVTTLAPRGGVFSEPRTEDLPGDAGQVSDVTMVGDRVVTLDADTGVLSVVGGATTSVPPGSELQQAGPAYDAVLVGAPDALLSIDLDSGESTTVSDLSGTPVAPVRLGACVFGAWSGGLGAVAVKCGSEEVTENTLKGSATNLAFRVNRGEIVLNDAASGRVWDVEQDHPIKIDNWEAFTSKKQSEDDENDNENQTDADRRPPRAEPDSYGVRAGRTTVLHPLDNDSAPEGRLLSIVDVDQPSGGARVEISPDGQTLVLQMPDDARPARFDYFIDDGRNGVSAHATVDVGVRAERQNEAPALRKGWTRPTYKVPSGGALAVPVLADWRDDSDGDTLLLDSATAVGGEVSGATARVTADGRIRFTAPTTRAEGQQLVRVDFAVTDGRSEAVRKSLSFQVQAPKDQRAFAPSAEPDVVRGEVGQPIKIRPLLNDLPGSDPGTPNADLVLGGKVPQQPGARIVSDLDAGQLTFTGDRPGTYFLGYDAGYGNAPLDQGTIRVDVKPRPKRAADPIAMPDTLTVFGQAPGIVDVLDNDLDPAGKLLVVQRAAGDVDGQLDVAIIDGRWLRISAVRPNLTPTTQTVSYTISNGASASVRGEVVVTQRAAPADNTPITVADKVVVRAGSAVSAPVLDNDVSPSGDRLTLLNVLVDSETPGQLEVVAPIDVKGDVGQAFVSGRVVRYVAPDVVKERDTYTVTYIAQNLDGKRASGRLQVTVVPTDDPNDPPEPPTLEARVVSGDTVKVRVPGVGVDRNGDPVTVTGITSAPRLGSITSYGGNFLEYQAYPRTAGTDEFSYAVVDSQGAFATGMVRIAVVEPGQPQPPLAVEDRLTVQPGRTATFDPLANDFIATGDSVEVELLGDAGGATLDPDTNLVTVTAPESLDAPPLTVVYRVTNGLSESRATMTLQTEADYNNPPIVYDAFGRADDSGSVVVDVLEGAYDPDGDAADLRVTRVSGDDTARVVDGAEVRANRGAAPKVLPFEVRDADGAAAVASVYIPPTGNGLPYVLPDTLIELDAGESVTRKLGDLVAAPDGADVRLASGRRSYSASPADLQVGAEDASSFTLTAPPGFRGPGAVLVEVTSAKDASGNEDTTTTADGATVLLSIPVQVGDDKPTLQCPSTVLPIAGGQRIDLDIATFCKVYTLDPRDAVGLNYSAEWSQSLDGVAVGSPDGSVVAVSAADTATQGGEAALTVQAGESNTQVVRFRLAQAPAPRLSPIKVETMEAGQTRTYDLADYLQAGVADPQPTIVSVQDVGQNAGVRATYEGSRLTLTADKDTRGVKAGFRIAVSDVSSSDPSPSRTAEGRIDFQVVGVPEAPGEPRPYPLSQQVGTVEMGWTPPKDDGGAPILHYVVREERTGDTQRCDTNECIFRGLEERRSYTFRVKAVNRVGESDWSGLSKTAQADTAPGRVQNIRMVDRGDGSITIAWDKPKSTSKIIDYTISWGGNPGVAVPGNTLSFTATGLNNNEKYVFSVKAQNEVDYSGVRQSPELQPLGTPPAPPAPAVTDLEAGANQTSLQVTWGAVLPEGPGPTTYTVSYTNGTTSGNVPGCVRLASLTCTHAGVNYDGLVYTYRVVAYNISNRSPASEGTSIEAVGRPAPWGPFQVRPTGVSQEAEVTYTVPESRGGTSRVEVLVGGLVLKTFAQQTGTNTTRVSTPGNEQPYAVQLRVCNEDAPAGCTLSGQQNVQTFGRLDNMLSDIPDPVVNGKTVTWTVSGSSNGDPAQLAVWIDGVAQPTINLTAVGSFSQSISSTTADFAQTTRLEVRLQDSAPVGRGESFKAKQSISGVPVPGVGVTRPLTRICRDDDTDPANDCWQGPGNNKPPPCEVNSCGFITFTAQGFYENFTCSVSLPWTAYAGWRTYNFGPTGAGAVSQDTDWYAPNGATVTCQGTGLWGQQQSGSGSW
ncbi:hypothetical protein ASG76_18355 [Nocardioides sp. Soil774]|uniref:Ig-like domain-containing protein n=1 Tax=Nocardioides sp. Soil774 TaxID=1736408 RepID=UPI000713D931|nr:fibronectin type III domain-containing protein [Nocardioides sp. Soil774]KRE96989.1 hypothetical protein ASG76_18355 [Nocardioides sp. Soil774]